MARLTGQRWTVPDRCAASASATVVRVAHDGAERVAITYARDGQPYRIRARAAGLGVGVWAARRIIADLPAPRSSMHFCIRRC